MLALVLKLPSILLFDSIILEKYNAIDRLKLLFNYTTAAWIVDNTVLIKFSCAVVNILTKNVLLNV